MAAWLRRLVAEPLFQFLVIGALVFGAYSLLQGKGDPEPETIVVSAGRMAQLAEIFSRTWQRQPTPEEMRGLVDSFVREEIFYREGRKLGLDEDDTVFRRRLQQKMEFLMEPSPAELAPGEGELEAFLAAHREAYRLPAEVAFAQVFVDPGKHDDAPAEAERLLSELRDGGAAVDPATLGDRTLLPAAMPLSSEPRIAATFGEDFAKALVAAPVGAWTGPVASSFGLHVVRVDEREAPRDPAFSEVADFVRRDWEDQRRREIAEQRYDLLREKYTVVVEDEAPETSPRVDAGGTGQ
ncbi:MAG: peptidyl-prolyl cis-trans isomerase [Bauldia sp.]|nr:peptidyl-prolyl cis-trans isomerase [Bauldia sp.]